MTSKSWSKRSVLACGIISLALTARLTAEPAAAIVLLDPADAARWQAGVQGLGWRVIAPAIEGNPNIDQRVQALAAAVRAAIADGSADPARIYLAGRADAAAGVFYTISRVPDLWAAGVALGGSPQPAIHTDRFFAANFKNVPVLWVSAGGPDDPALAGKLKNAGVPLEFRAAGGFTDSAIFEWLRNRARAPYPLEIDCETNSPNYASCYWIHLTKFDAGERNDVLPSSHLPASSRAALDLGGFGFQLDEPGPGVLVSSLPPKFPGPLKIGDRIVEMDGKPIENARRYTELMAAATQERVVVLMVQRGKERIRLETRIVLPRREPFATARVEAQYRPEEKEIQIVSRTVTEMRVTVPPEWAGGKLYWNGLMMDVETAGCLVLTVDKELLHAAKCP